MRAGHQRYFGIDIFRADLKSDRLGNQIADFGQEFPVSAHIGNRAGICLVPSIKLGLNVIAFGQQSPIDRYESRKDIGKPLPKRSGFNASSGQSLALDKIGQNGCNLQSGAVHII